jgi:hypothetical protein
MGDVTECPKMLVRMDTLPTSLSTRGRSMISAYAALLRRYVCRSVAADVTKASVLGAKVARATAAKSWVEIKLSSGGLDALTCDGAEARGEDHELGIVD